MVSLSVSALFLVGYEKRDDSIADRIPTSPGEIQHLTSSHDAIYTVFNPFGFLSSASLARISHQKCDYDSPHLFL